MISYGFPPKLSSEVLNLKLNKFTWNRTRRISVVSLLLVFSGIYKIIHLFPNVVPKLRTYNITSLCRRLDVHDDDDGDFSGIYKIIHLFPKVVPKL